jgi:ribosome maturation factor RimP
MSRPIDRVKAIAEPLAAELGLYLYDVAVIREKGTRIQLTAERIKKPTRGEGITITECARLSHAVDREIELEEVFPGKFVLEVSSPGVERTLVSKQHFEGAVGEAIEVVTRRPIRGTTQFTGRLVSVDDDCIEINLSKSELIAIPLPGVRRARTVFQTVGK